MKKLLGIIIILAGIALTVLWISKDPGWSAVFKRSAIIIGFIPIPGRLFGFVLQLAPALIGLALGGSMFSK